MTISCANTKDRPLSSLLSLSRQKRGRESFIDTSLLVLCLMGWFAEKIDGFEEPVLEGGVGRRRPGRRRGAFSLRIDQPIDMPDGKMGYSSAPCRRMIV